MTVCRLAPPRLLRRRSLAPAVLATLALTGCGSSDEKRAQAAPPAPSPTQTADLGTTDGRTGEATTATGASAPRRLSPGGPLDPEPRPGPDGRSGVVDPASCPGEPTAPPTDGNRAAVGETTLCLINAERTELGLTPLTANPDLADAAQAHAADMVARTYFAHESPDGTSASDRIKAAGYLSRPGKWTVGENLAWGSGALSTAVSIHNSWMNSPGHRENMLKPEYREVGVGIATGNPARPSGTGATYATTFGVIAGGRGASGSDSSAGATEEQSGGGTAGEDAGAGNTPASSAAAKRARRCRSRRGLTRKRRQRCARRASASRRGSSR